MAILSLVLVGATYLICDYLRHSLKARLPEGTVKHLILDALLSAELCTGAFELGVIFDHYGLYVWCIGLFFNSLYQCLRWEGFSMPSPGAHLESYLHGHHSFTDGLLRTATLVTSGLITYQFISCIWDLEVSVLHKGRAGEMAMCSVPWGHNTPTYISFLAEVLGTVFLGVTIPLIAENPTLSNNDPLYTGILISGLVVATVVAALEVSGGMFNPMLATALLINCDGHAHWQHVLVYWVGGAVGTWIAANVYPTAKGIVYGNKENKEQTKKKAE